MAKAVYSIILSDEVIEKIDSMAYAMRTSRSNYINEVLADHVSYTTPQQRIKDILDSAKAFLEPQGRYAFVEMSSNSFMDIRSALSYRYRPTIRYCVEIIGEKKGPFCRLKAQVRTQNSSLMSAIEGFFMVWQSVERKLIPDAYDELEMTSYENVCYTRIFYIKDETDTNEERIGKAIASYIATLDKALKLFLDNADDTEYAINSIYGMCRDFYTRVELII
ncbi:MAG: hypothetical protein WC332_05820 [Clostridia bacterium]|jgi:predicted transcriptional regulator